MMSLSYNFKGGLIMRTKGIFAVLFIIVLLSFNALANIPDFKVNQIPANGKDAWHNQTHIVTDRNGNFVVMWLTTSGLKGYTSTYTSDIYFQRYTKEGKALGDNVMVTSGQEGEFQLDPFISMDPDGNFTITWIDCPTPSYKDRKICAQLYKIGGSLNGPKITVNDDDTKTQRLGTASAMGGEKIIVTWSDRRDGDWNNYAQQFKSDGTPLGGNFKVNDDKIAGDRNSASVTATASGDFIFVWAEELDKNWDIYGQRFSSSRIPIGPNFKINDDEEQANQLHPAISSDTNGNFLVAWTDNRILTDVFAQRYSNSGAPLGANFKVNDDNEFEPPQFAPSVSMNEIGDFVIFWQDGRNDRFNIYGQCYLNNGTPAGNNFLVPNTNESGQWDPDVKLVGKQIYSTWKDDRMDTSEDYDYLNSDLDIWANVLEWDQLTGINSNDNVKAPSTIELAQNYPNPFNPSTVIQYSLQEFDDVVLEVYDIHGKEIQILVDEFQKAGTYTVRFFAKNLASGIYIYKLSVGSNLIQTKRMVLLR
jgi:hypothetical protein